MTDEAQNNGDAAPAAADQTQNNAPPASSDTPPADANAAPEFKIRDDYKDRPWASKIKSEDDLYKQLDNLNVAVGKKSVAPDFEKATPQEIEDYYNQLRPADKAEYDKLLNFDEITSDDEKAYFADLLHKNGLPPAIANQLLKATAEFNGKLKEAAYGPKGFDEVLQKSFGDDFKKTGGEVARHLKQHLNAEDSAALENLPNEALGLVYRLANNMTKAYGANETSSAASKGAANNGAVDFAQQRIEIRKQIDDLNTRPHTAEEKQKLIDKLTATYKS